MVLLLFETRIGESQEAKKPTSKGIGESQEGKKPTSKVITSLASVDVMSSIDDVGIVIILFGIGPSSLSIFGERVSGDNVVLGILEDQLEWK